MAVPDISSLGAMGAGAASGGPVGLAIASLPELFKTISGVDQLIKAGKINPQRPLFKVPQAVNEATNTARANYYNNELPEQNYITGRIGASTAQSIRAAEEAGRTPAEILQAAAGAQGNEGEALMNLAMEGGRNQQQKANSLYGQLDNEGNWQNMASDYNERKPYAEESAAKSNLTQAGNTNIYGGLNGLAKVGVSASDGGITTPTTTVPNGINPYLMSTPTTKTVTADNSTQSGFPGMSTKQLYSFLVKNYGG